MVADNRRLRRTFLRALTWTAVARSGTQTLSWLATLLVARLLTPDDYGLFRMAMVYLGLVALLNEFGIGAAVVTLRDLDRHRLAMLNTLALGLGACSALLSVVVALPIGRFFHEDVLPAMIVLLSSTFLLTALRSVPQALLQRDLRFRRLVVIEALEVLAEIIVIVLLAFLGAGVWALVVGRIIGAGAGTGLILFSRRERFGRPSVAPLRRALSFSADIFVANLAWFFYTQFPVLVLGRVLGANALGVYALAWTLSQLPVEKFSSLVLRLLPPFFSALASDRAALRRSFLRLTEAVAAVVVPVAVGIALVGGEIVAVILGDHWSAVEAPLRLLAIHAAFQSIVSILPHILRVTGDTRFLMWRNLAIAAVLPPAFLVVVDHGTTGVAWVWLTVYPVMCLPLFRRIFHALDLSMMDYLAALRPVVSSAGVMAIIVLLVQAVAPSETPRAALLGVEVGLGAAAYVATALLLHRSRVQSMLSLFLEPPRSDRPALREHDG